MRNSETIVNISRAFGKNKEETNSITPKKNIAGPICYSYDNKGSIDYMLLVKAAINKYFKSKPGEPVVVVILMEYAFFKGDRKTKTAGEFEKYLKVSFPDRKVVVMENERNDYQNIQSFLRHPNGIFVSNIDNFRGAQARNVILIINDHFYVDLNSMLRDPIMRIMSFAIIIFSKVELRNAKGLVEDRDLHHFINCGPDKPFCYEIDGKAYDKADLVIAIIDKYFIESLDCIVILNYESKGKKLYEGLKNKIGDNKEVVFLPTSLGYIKLIKAFKETQTRPNTVLITDSLEWLQPVSNIIVFELNTGARNHILQYQANTIIIHKGDLEELNNGILQPHTATVENIEEKMFKKIKKIFHGCKPSL